MPTKRLTTYSQRHKNGVPGKQTWNEKRMPHVSEGKRNQHAGLYRLDMRSPSIT